MADESEDLAEDLLTEYAIQLSIQESNTAKPPVSSSYNDRYCKFSMCMRGYAIYLECLEILIYCFIPSLKQFLVWPLCIIV